MKGAPPYSCTRVRTLTPCAVSGAATPLCKLNSDTTPPAAGTFSVQYRPPLALRKSPKLIPPAARACALKGEAQDPYGATVGAAVGAIVGAGGVSECAVTAANRLKRMPPILAVAVMIDGVMLRMCGS
jgi:hypothetical protein